MKTNTHHSPIKHAAPGQLKPSDRDSPATSAAAGGSPIELRLYASNNFPLKGCPAMQSKRPSGPGDFHRLVLHNRAKIMQLLQWFERGAAYESSARLVVWGGATADNMSAFHRALGAYFPALQCSGKARGGGSGGAAATGGGGGASSATSRLEICIASRVSSDDVQHGPELVTPVTPQVTTMLPAAPAVGVAAAAVHAQPLSATGSAYDQHRVAAMREGDAGAAAGRFGAPGSAPAAAGSAEAPRYAAEAAAGPGAGASAGVGASKDGGQQEDDAVELAAAHLRAQGGAAGRALGIVERIAGLAGIVAEQGASLMLDLSEALEEVAARAVRTDPSAPATDPKPPASPARPSAAPLPGCPQPIARPAQQAAGSPPRPRQQALQQQEPGKWGRGETAANLALCVGAAGRDLGESAAITQRVAAALADVAVQMKAAAAAGAGPPAAAARVDAQQGAPGGARSGQAALEAAASGAAGEEGGARGLAEQFDGGHMGQQQHLRPGSGGGVPLRGGGGIGGAPIPWGRRGSLAAGALSRLGWPAFGGGEGGGEGTV